MTIIVIANREYDERQDRAVYMVSHGVDTDTDMLIPLPQVEAHHIAVFDSTVGEYILNES